MTTTTTIYGKCGTCGGPTSREVPTPPGTDWWKTACPACDPIQKAHPEIFEWIQKVVAHQVEKAMADHERGHADRARDY